LLPACLTDTRWAHQAQEAQEALKPLAGFPRDRQRHQGGSGSRATYLVERGTQLAYPPREEQPTGRLPRVTYPAAGLARPWYVPREAYPVLEILA
jgi:hypothetical protein